MKKLIPSSVLLSSVVFVSGCSTASKDVTPTYVSPLVYQGSNCSQLVAEEQRLNVRIAELGGRLDNKATRDKVLVATFYGAAFVGGNKDQEAEYARLTGELNAVRQAAIQNNCNIQNKPTPEHSASVEGQ